ncbi:MAG: helix-turn-helix domain-containing protein [bacterium]
MRKFERETILKALQQAGQDKSKAAGFLNMSLSTLYRKMAELGIPSKE